MPRQPRAVLADGVFHVFNRANSRRTLFKTDDDYRAFIVAMLEALRHTPIRILAWCIMPNHFHLVLWPRSTQEMSQFMRRLTQTHAQRWRWAHETVGYGSLYQGRFKSFVVQEDVHLLILLRYVERNALRAGLVRRAEDWPWASAWVRLQGDAKTRALLHDWPVERPRNWIKLLNEPQTPAEEEAIRLSLKRGRPLGDPLWVQQTARRLGLVHTLREPGRPSKSE